MRGRIELLRQDFPVHRPTWRPPLPHPPLPFFSHAGTPLLLQEPFSSFTFSTWRPLTAIFFDNIDEGCGNGRGGEENRRPYPRLHQDGHQREKDTQEREAARARLRQGRLHSRPPRLPFSQVRNKKAWRFSSSSFL